LDFEREHERVGRELDRWLRTDLPAAREELADAIRGMLGVGRWRRRGLPQQPACHGRGTLRNPDE
jgi:predicted RNA polymerase sigma factor